MNQPMFASQELEVRGDSPLYLLRYRAHLRWFYRALNCVALLLLTIGCAGAFYSMHAQNPGAFVSFAVPIILGVLLLAETSFILKPLLDSKIGIYRDRFAIHKTKTTIDFFYHELTEVRFVMMGPTGSWFSVKRFADTKSYRFSVMLENSYAIINAIERARPELFKNQKRLDGFKRTLICADHAWQRHYEHLTDWPMLAFKYLVFPAAGVMVLSDLAMRSRSIAPAHKEIVALGLGIAFVMTCLTSAWTIFFIREQIFARKIYGMLMYRNAPLVLKRNRKYEAKLSTIGNVAYFAIALSVLAWSLL